MQSHKQQKQNNLLFSTQPLNFSSKQKFPIITISCEGHVDPNSKAILIIARQRYEDSLVSYFIGGMLSYITSSQSEAIWLRSKLTFYIIPFLGIGDQFKKLKKGWGKTSAKLHYPVHCTKNFMFDIIQSNVNLAYVIDISQHYKKQDFKQYTISKRGYIKGVYNKSNSLLLEAFSFLYERQNDFISSKDSRFFEENDYSDSFLNIISNMICIGLFMSLKIPSFFENQISSEILKSILQTLGQDLIRTLFVFEGGQRQVMTLNDYKLSKELVLKELQKLTSPKRLAAKTSRASSPKSQGRQKIKLQKADQVYLDELTKKLIRNTYSREQKQRNKFVIKKEKVRNLSVEQQILVRPMRALSIASPNYRNGCQNISFTVPMQIFRTNVPQDVSLRDTPCSMKLLLESKNCSVYTDGHERVVKKMLRSIIKYRKQSEDQQKLHPFEVENFK